MKDIMDIAKRRGFFWPSFEIYGGVSGFYTYGPVGALLKLRVQDFIRNYYIINENCMLLDAPLLTPEDPWVASGHLKSFTDMTAECQNCGEAYRADHLVEEKTKKSMDGKSLNELGEIIEKNKIKCPRCGGKLGSLYDYNLMFKTYIGPGKRKITGYLRPETAQTTYMPFRRLYDLARKQIPFGVIQIGKSFRNEISPRQGITRLREFSQAEVQFFVDPKEKNKHPLFKEVNGIKMHVWTKNAQKLGKSPTIMSLGEIVQGKHGKEFLIYHLGRILEIFEKMGIDKERMRLRQHRDDELAFYSEDTWDVEFKSDSFGMIELIGVADRTDYDLNRHMEQSKVDMRVEMDGKKIIPHVVEFAYGLDRPTYCIMESCLREDKDRTFFAFPPGMAPYEVAVFPLVKKDNLPEKAREFYDILKKNGFYVIYDEGFIGKVYYRQDEIGTPLAVTVDYDTLKDGSVTLRDRDTQKQIRVSSSDLVSTITGILGGEKIEKFGKVLNK